MCYSKLRSTSNDVLKGYGGLDKNDLNRSLEHFWKNEDPEDIFTTSHYFDIDTLVSELTNAKDDFTLLSLNIECLNAKFDKLCAFLHILSEKGLKFSAIALQETWLAEDANIDMFKIQGYHKPVHQGYICGKKGGLILYLSERFAEPSIRKDLYSPSKWWEGMFVDIHHEDLPHKITIGNVYRPPRDNYSNSSLNQFLRPVTEIVKTLTKENSLLQFCGDYNINLLQNETRLKFQEYFDIFVANGLMPQITLPTRLSKRNATLIDQIFCKPTKTMTPRKSGIIVTQISDHLPCFLALSIPKINKNVAKFVKVSDHSPAAIDSFKRDITDSISDTNFNKSHCIDPNKTYNTWRKLYKTPNKNACQNKCQT